ncbi:hypothetical protein GJQ54_09280 [Oceanospirillaceae bacterium ASx5O]|nr:hypothetical protein GJQ54_09280 [Oceanospirillaceae bacterium ASx5O]
MTPDSVPLISAATVKTALARPATAPASSAVSDGRGQPASTVELQVSSSQRQSEGFRLTLTSAQGQQLQVLSEQDLPAGSRLILQLPDANTSSGKPLQVLSISLPAAPGTTPAPPSAPGAATVTEALTQVLNRFIAARLGLGVQPQPARPAAPAADLYARPSASTAAGTQAGTSAGNSSPSINAASARTELLNLLQQLASPGSVNTAPRPVSSQTSATSNLTVNTTLPGQPMPAAVQRVLQNWLQTLPAPAQLSQPAGLQQAIQNSGLSYEQRLFSALSNPPASNRQSNTTEAGNLFRQLWQRAAALAQPNPATSAAASTAPGAEASPAATNPASSNVAALLQAVQQKLEQPGQSGSATTAGNIAATSPAAPGLLASLFSSDHKAVLGKALLIWAQQLHQHSGNDSPPPRTLPMLPPADMPETFRLLQAALAQTETEQVQRLQQGDSWQLQIPLFYRDGEIPREVQLHLHKDSEQNDADGKRKAVRWRLRLHFDLQQLGPLDIDIELQYPALSATFWSQQAPTLTQLNRELQPLRQRLQQLGVEVQELQVRHGQLPAPERNRISQRLVDIHS